MANSEGATPLSLACMNGNAAIMESLLKAGADPNESIAAGGDRPDDGVAHGQRGGYEGAARSRSAGQCEGIAAGTTALMWAADQGHAAAMQLLVDRGADLNVRSNPAPRGRTAYLGKANDPRRSNRALAAAAAGATREEVERLARKGATAGPARAGQDGQPAAAAQPQQQRTPRRARYLSGGALPPLVFATRANSIEAVNVLLAAGADINQATGYGWTPLLVATHNRFYRLGSFLLDQGADPNKANNGDWTPLYLAVDNRNIESGDYPVRKGDMDHLDFIKKLLDKGADVNARMKDSTETRTVFTNQWLDENGATAFLRASQSADLEADAAAARARRRSEDRHGWRCDGVTGRSRYRLG